MDYQKTYSYPTTLNQTTEMQMPQTQQSFQQTMPQFTAPQPQPYPMQPAPLPQPTPLPSQPTTPILPQEQSYIENILRLNKGKVGTFYFTYTDSQEWRDRIYKGVIEAAGRDHLIISDPKTGKRYLFQMIYFVWAEFDEEIAYNYPYR